MKNGCRLKHCRACPENQKLETTSLTQQLRMTETSEKPRSNPDKKAVHTQHFSQHTSKLSTIENTMCPAAPDVAEHHEPNRTDVGFKAPDRFLTITWILFCHANTSRHHCFSNLVGFNNTYHLTDLCSTRTLQLMFGLFYTTTSPQRHPISISIVQK